MNQSGLFFNSIFSIFNFSLFGSLELFLVSWKKLFQTEYLMISSTKICKIGCLEIWCIEKLKMYRIEKLRKGFQHSSYDDGNSISGWWWAKLLLAKLFLVGKFYPPLNRKLFPKSSSSQCWHCLSVCLFSGAVTFQNRQKHTHTHVRPSASWTDTGLVTANIISANPDEAVAKPAKLCEI